jgi:hypothetical protein
MNIFTKSKLNNILSVKVKEGEIKSFHLTDDYLRIQKSKRTGYTFHLNEFSDKTLLRIISKKTPNPSIKNIEDFYKKEISYYGV